MEDIAQAIKIIGSVLIVVIAITVSFSLISKSKKTSDEVLKYIDPSTLRGEMESAVDNYKEVKIDTVIATLFRYSKESFSVKVLDSSGNVVNVDGQALDFNLQNKNSFGTQEQLEEHLKLVVADILNSSLADETFEERFDEAVITGRYDEGDDESSIIIESGSKKMYITYTVR